MRRLLVEGAELFHQDCNSIDRLMMYVDNNLGMLHNQLNEENFKRILEIVWDNLARILDDLIQSNLEVSCSNTNEAILNVFFVSRNVDRHLSLPICTKL